MAPADIKGKKAVRPQKSTLHTTPDTSQKTGKKRAGQKQSLKRRSPAENNQTTPASAGASKRQKKTQLTPRTSTLISLDRDEETLPSEERSSSEEPEYILAEITTVDGPKSRPADSKSADPRVDYKLVTTILHEVAFKKKKTRITKDGVKLFTKYIESFVNEAVSRSIEEKRTKNATGMDTPGIRTEAEHKNYLETEDLERAYPQLMLDF